MVRGSCLCGAVSFEVDGPCEAMWHCHCSMCRKVHGAAFGTYVGTAAEGFCFTSGEDRIARYESSPGWTRDFCSGCGSVVPDLSPTGRVSIAAGNLDDDPGVRPSGHIFVASKAPWFELTDGLPRFGAYPPGLDLEPCETKPRAESRAGIVRGSCLCDGVAWEVEGRPSRFHHCHCSRCRKARSAAHASNLFFAPEGFRWLRGEDLLRSYKVPEARVFTNVFCGVCGSIEPRVAETYVVVPAGSVDGDPQAGEPSHIFVGSRAPWYDITDGFARFEAAWAR